MCKILGVRVHLRRALLVGIFGPEAYDLGNADRDVQLTVVGQLRPRRTVE
jgi:hypothetical protein